MTALLQALRPDLETLLRLGVAVACGMAVGFNRAHHGNLPHSNRLRVHVLVALSACLVVLAAGGGLDARSRAIQGVATGVGFLGAGEILVTPPRGRQHPPEVRGLTSAASIWFTAALGVTVAAASPGLALVALVLALITLSDRHPGGGGPGGGSGNGGSGGGGSEGSGGGSEGSGGGQSERGKSPEPIGTKKRTLFKTEKRSGIAPAWLPRPHPAGPGQAR